jgi:hypothetical protein
VKQSDWRIAIAVSVSSLLALVSCAATGTNHGAVDETAPTFTPVSHVDEARGPFDMFAASPHTVIVVGRLISVRDSVGHPFTDADGLRYREMTITISRVIKGSGLVAGPETKILSTSSFPGSELSSDDVGRTFLMLGGVGSVKSFDGSRFYPNVFGYDAETSYELSRIAGRDFAVRLFSPLAKRLGNYDGTRVAIAARILAGLDVRKVDALPWSELLDHATNPRALPASQLGADES